MRICSVTPHQLMNNPRIVKEANALAEAGHDVRVIAVRNRPDHSAHDRSFVHGRQWRLQLIDIDRTGEGRWRWFVTGARQKIATSLWRRMRRGRYLAGMAYGRTFSEAVRRIVSEPTDLIIAHTQPMLAPAWLAARRFGCRWGFDCEDILSEEYGEGIADQAHQDLVRYVESTFIPAADFVTVASPEFGPWLANHYGVASSQFIANVPSLSDAPREIRPGYPHGRAHLSLYWFSMSIGPLRGLEDVLRALPLITVPVTLHIRGRMLQDYGSELRAMIAALEICDRVVLHDLTAPENVVRAAADHDIGLVLSQPCCENHQMWAPNKLYAYMMAGLAVGATATPGHHAVLATAPGVGFEYPPGDYVQLAAGVNVLARHPDRLRACREEAFRLARARFNWEIEQHRLVELVAGLGGQPARSTALQAAQA